MSSSDWGGGQDDYDEDAETRSKRAADKAWEQAQKEAKEQREAAERNEN